MISVYQEDRHTLILNYKHLKLNGLSITEKEKSLVWLIQ